MAGKDCDCKSIKVAEFTSQRPRVATHHATGGESLVSSLLRAAETLGGDTSKMANSELVDALCAALIEAREEKQALAKALDECFESNEELQEQLDENLFDEDE